MASCRRNHFRRTCQHVAKSGGLFGGSVRNGHTYTGDPVRVVADLAALALVANRVRKTPAARDAVRRVFETANAHDVMVRTSGNTVILLPRIVTAEDVNRIIEAPNVALAAV